MEKNSEDQFKEIMGKFKVAYAISNAIYEDYAETISKIQGISVDEVKKRLNIRIKENFDSFMTDTRWAVEKEEDTQAIS